MKIATFIGMILVASVIFIGFNIVINDFETSLIDTNYTEATPFSDAYETSFNQSAKIEEEFNDTIEGLQSLGDSGNWWQELGDFIGAIPVVLVEFPSAIFAVYRNTIGNIGTILNELGIPTGMVAIALIGLVIWLMFKLINFWKSGEEI